MNLELTDEQLALRDTVRRFLTEKASIADHVRPLLDDPTGSTDEVWRGLAALGATGVLVGEEHGGSGLTMVEAGAVAEELGCSPVPRTLAVERRRRDPRPGPHRRGRCGTTVGHRRRHHDRHRRTPGGRPAED